MKRATKDVVRGEGFEPFRRIRMLRFRSRTPSGQEPLDAHACVVGLHVLSPALARTKRSRRVVVSSLTWLGDPRNH